MTGEPTEPSPAPPPPVPPPLRPDTPSGRPSRRRLYRRRDDRMIGGVAAGLADYLDADVALVRIAWVAIALLTGGLGALAYLAAWVLMPVEDAAVGRDAEDESGAATSTWHRRERPRSAWGGLIWGAILIIVGVAVLLPQLAVPAPPWRAVLAVALILVGLAIVAAARRGLNGGLLVLAIVLTAALATSARLPLIGVDSGFGDRRVSIAGPDQVDAHYGHAFGSMRIEVTRDGLPDGTTPLDTSIAFGDMLITVPEGVGVRVTAATAFGSTRVFGEELGAFVDDDVMTSPGYDQAAKRVDLHVNTAFGSTRILRGQP